MLNQSELKTLVPSLVMSGVLLYEAITGNAVSEHVQGELVNGILIGAGYMVTLWGIWKNHQKTSEAKQTAEITKPKIPPDQTTAVQTDNVSRGTSPPLAALHPTPSETGTGVPIVTQEDLNKQIGG